MNSERLQEQLQGSLLLHLILRMIFLTNQKCSVSLLQSCACYTMKVGHRLFVSSLLALRRMLAIEIIEHSSLCISGQISEPAKGIFGAGAHTDYGLITLLASDENLGLQVRIPLCTRMLFNLYQHITLFDYQLKVFVINTDLQG